MSNEENNYVTRLDMAEVVEQHQVFDVFKYIARQYPNLAEALFDKYVDFIRNNNKRVLRIDDPEKRNEEAKYIASGNIGYFISNCSDLEERKFLAGIYPMARNPIPR